MNKYEDFRNLLVDVYYTMYQMIQTTAEKP